MNVTRNVSLTGTEEIAGVTINYTTNYTDTEGPTNVHVSGVKNEPGMETRIYRTFTPDGKYTPAPLSPAVAPFDKAFNDAILTSVMSIFTDYKTL